VNKTSYRKVGNQIIKAIRVLNKELDNGNDDPVLWSALRDSLIECIEGTPEVEFEITGDNDKEFIMNILVDNFTIDFKELCKVYNAQKTVEEYE
jgi:hypothetical protein